MIYKKLGKAVHTPCICNENIIFQIHGLWGCNVGPSLFPDYGISVSPISYCIEISLPLKVKFGTRPGTVVPVVTRMIIKVIPLNLEQITFSDSRISNILSNNYLHQKM